MRQRSPTSFSRLLRNAVLAFILGGATALVAYSVYSWEREEQEVRENLSILSSFLATVSQSFFDNLGNGLVPLGQLLEQNRLLDAPEGSRRHLLEFQGRYPEVSAMAVFAPDGRMLVNTAVKAGDPLPDFRVDPPYIRRLLQDMQNPTPYIIGAPEFGKALQRWRFAIRHVVRDRDGRPRFLIQAAIPLEHEGSFLHQLPIPPSSFIGLLRADGYQQARWPIKDTSAIYGQLSKGAVAEAIRANPGIKSGVTRGTSYWRDSRGQRIAAHQRRHGGRRHGTDPDHMPSAHRRYAEWTPERFRRWGASIGPNTEGLVIVILANRPHPEQGFRTCLGILRLFKDIAPERAEIVAARAVAIGALTYKSISAIIANRTDRKTPADDVVIDHPNLRGPGYFH